MTAKAKPLSERALVNCERACWVNGWVTLPSEMIRSLIAEVRRSRSKRAGKPAPRKERGR